MNYFIFKDKSTIDFDIIVNKLPDIESPEEEGEYIKVPGRDGYLFQSDGCYSELNKKTEITLKNLDKVNNIKSWLTGEGKLILSSEPDVFYKARIKEKLNIKRAKSVWEADINFICKSFGYIHTGQDVITLEAETELYNQGTYKSKPIITVYGTGDITLTVNSKNIILTNITDHITLNSEIEEAYRDLLNMNNSMLGEFVEFETGTNQISWTGNVIKIEVTPNWRNR